MEPGVKCQPGGGRSALVGGGERGAQRPGLCVELRAGIARDQRPRIADELRHLGEGFVHAARVETFLFHPRFPVDIRHKAKIGREKLAAWAAKQHRSNRRSDEQTSELQTLMRITYAVFCWNNKQITE